VLASLPPIPINPAHLILSFDFQLNLGHLATLLYQHESLLCPPHYASPHHTALNSKHNPTTRAAAKNSRKTSKPTASTYDIPPGPFAQTVIFLQQAFLLSCPPAPRARAPAAPHVDGLGVPGAGGARDGGAAEEEGLLEEVNSLGEGSRRDAVGGGCGLGCFARVFGGGLG
jgi:hypothetical protein